MTRSHRLASLAWLAVMPTVGPTGAVALPSAPAVAVRDTTRLGVPFTRYTTRDRFQRTITFYVSHPPESLAQRALPLALVVTGSGSQSIWVRVGDRIGGGHQNLMRRVGRSRVRVLAVEKPGVTFLVQPEQPGSAIEASEEFKREHTFERWTEANRAALAAALTLPGIDTSRVLALGHSEGASIVARLAAIEPRVTHVAPLAGAGASQLFDFTEQAGEPVPGDKPGDATRRRAEILQQWQDILADPNSTSKMWLGHPYRRWSTFLGHNCLEDLLRTRARIFLAHGTLDRAVPVVSFDWLRAELAARGRPFVAERLDGLDHGFFGPEGPPADPREPAGLERVMGRVLDWFFGD